MTPRPRQEGEQSEDCCSLDSDGDDCSPNDETLSLLLATTTTNPVDQYDYTLLGDNMDPLPAKILYLTMDEAIERLGYGRFQKCLLVATGLCMMADALEVLLLSFLTLVLRSSGSSHWDLTNIQTSSITASVFAGAIFGALALGRLADLIGRKPIFVLTAAMVAFFGLATGLAPNYEILLFCRFWVGFGVGGLTVPFITLSEFLPSSHRGHNLLLIEFFWTAGSMLVVLLAYLTLEQGTTTAFDDEEEGDDEFWESWRSFVMLCAIPCVVTTLWALIFVPESPRWLMTTKNDPHKALKVLREAAAVNGMDPDIVFPPNTELKPETTCNNPESSSQDEDNNGSGGRFSDLFSPQWRSTTLFLWGTWFGFSFLYYGSVIATTMVFANNRASSEPTTSHTYHFDYGALFISSSAEIVGNAIIVMTVDRLGRVKTQAAAYFGGGVMILLLCLLASSTNHDNYHLDMVILAFGTRMLMMISSCTTWVSTAELLPTNIRATGQSAANAMARIGGFVCPFVVGQSFSLREIGFIMCGIACGTAFCALRLPETLGRELGSAVLDSSDDFAMKKPIIQYQESSMDATTCSTSTDQGSSVV